MEERGSSGGAADAPATGGVGAASESADVQQQMALSSSTVSSGWVTAASADVLMADSSTFTAKSEDSGVLVESADAQMVDSAMAAEGGADVEMETADSGEVDSSWVSVKAEPGAEGGGAALAAGGAASAPPPTTGTGGAAPATGNAASQLQSATGDGAGGAAASSGGLPATGGERARLAEQLDRIAQAALKRPRIPQPPPSDERFHRAWPATRPALSEDINRIWGRIGEVATEAEPHRGEAWLKDLAREALGAMKRLQAEGGVDQPALFLRMPEVAVEPPSVTARRAWLELATGGFGEAAQPATGGSGKPAQPATGGSGPAQPATGGLAASPNDLSQEAKIKLLVQLATGKHKGEAADVHTVWEAVQGPLPQAGEWYHSQFQLCGKADKPDYGQWDYGVDTADHIQGRGWMPNWRRQVNRWLVDHGRWHWQRRAKVVTLARLFCRLGRDFTAEALYAFYLELRLVAAKKFRNPGAAPRRQRAELFWHARNTIPQMCRELGLPVPDGKAQLAALMAGVPTFVAALTLAAARPQWLAGAPAPGGAEAALSDVDLGKGASASLHWQVMRSSLLHAPASALPEEAQKAVGTSNVICQCLFRCPKLVEARLPNARCQCSQRADVLPPSGCYC